jgi:predicted DNA-binding transcriptional regulator YafY
VSAGMQTTARFTIERLRLIAFMLRAGKKFTAVEIARGFEVSRKTIHRDLDALARMGYDHRYDRRERRYRLERAPTPAL